VVVVVGGPEHVNRKLSALPLVLVLVHGVLKWLHHLVLKYVMLLHAAESSHDFLHWSRLDTFPGELSRYTSPASTSHLTPSMGLVHVHFHIGAVVVVLGIVPVVHRKATALLLRLVLVQAELKGLHHPLLL
jgi:hypothetical protein